MFRLDNKVAVVTGAARGIGAATARALAAQGARVALADINGEEVAAVAEEIGAAARSYTVDLSSVPALQDFVRAVASDFDGIDILVNNAGICPRLPFAESTEEHWNRLTAVNSKSMFFLMQAVQPVLKSRGGGKIINLGSTGGRVGSFDSASIYSGTKGAIIMMSKSIAREMAKDGILVNCVAPGVLDTDLVRNLPEDRIEKLCATIPLGRLGKPEEVAALICYLASDECSYCTGATFDINGGWVML